MGCAPSVLLLDDGELDDVQAMLDEMGIACARVRGGAIVDGTPPPRDLLIATPRRIQAVRDALPDTEDGPVRVMVVNEDSNSLRRQLRRSGFDYLVRRPVHAEALRLLLLHCIYKGEERRSEPRVAVGFEVSFRSGFVTRRATLVDLSIRGCRLLSETRVEPGRRIRLQIPEALETGDPFSVTGRVVRLDGDKDGEGSSAVAVSFEQLDESARQALEIIIEDRALGPATLGPGQESGAVPVELRIEDDEDSDADAGSDSAEELAWGETESTPYVPASERRRTRRGAYAQTIPAFGNRALRVLVGRDLSTGGMRIERLAGLETGDRMHLALYGEPGAAPLLVWGTVARDDGEAGLAIVFDPIDSAAATRLERLVSSLPAVESLHDSETAAMGTVVSEIVE